MYSNNSSNVTINSGNNNNKRLPELTSKSNTSIPIYHTLQPQAHIDCDNESDYNSPTLITSPIASLSSKKGEEGGGAITTIKSSSAPSPKIVKLGHQ